MQKKIYGNAVNEIVFILALLLEKKIITIEEARKLRRLILEQSLTLSIDETQKKIQKALKEDDKNQIRVVDASELIR